VRVISPSRLRRFWECRKSDAHAAQRDLYVWQKLAEKAVWANFASLKQTFGSADMVGNCVVFDVGNNRYRLIGRVFYSPPPFQGRIYVLRVMDHQEYDKGSWVNDCGCHKPPPKKPTVPPKMLSEVKPARRGQEKR
jgi:mRNA interferase HigB